MASTMLLFIVLGAVCTPLFIGRLSCAQSETNECSLSVPVHSYCVENSTGNWTSNLLADNIDFTYVNLSWTPHPDIAPTEQGRYEIYLRRVTDEDEPPNDWRVRQVNETFYNSELNTLSSSVEELRNGRRLEMRVCVSSTPQLPVNSTIASSECGYCTLCVRTMEGSLTLLTAESTTNFEEGLSILVCRAMGNPQPTIRWDAEISDTRVPLSDPDTSFSYTIEETLENDEPPFVVSSTLEYNPDSVDFINPDCIIENEVDDLRVTNPEFSHQGGMSLELVSATFQLMSDGTIVYTCEVISVDPPVFDWRAYRNGDMRFTLPASGGLVEIETTIDTSFTSISTLTYLPELVEFVNPECVVNTGTASSLRVQNSDFTEVQVADLGRTVELPVWGIILLVIVPGLIIAGVIGTGITVKCVMRNRNRQKVSMTIQQHKNEPNDYTTSVPLKTVPNEPSSLYGPLETELPSHMIVPSSDIKVSTVIGQGEFGVVYKGTLTRTNQHELVAVKTLKGIFATASDIQSFTEEILILQQFDHPNVMSLIGVCLGADKAGGGPSIILPFMSKGSLLNFLRKESDRLRPSEEADVTQIGAVEKNLVQICLQISRGMEYLAAQRFVHRDLAARNCMIDQNDQIRVGDFGLSEDVYAKNYFRQASNDGVKLPVKWMSLESLKLGVFSEKTDVWSYGVTCWEVFSCGEIPYPGIHPQQVLALLDNGQRLSKPRNSACSDQIYSVLLSCWQSDPNKRKTFKVLCTRMEELLNSMSDYLDLNVIASTNFSDSAENPYAMADDTNDYEGALAADETWELSGYEGGVPQADAGVYCEDMGQDEIHDSRSVDMLYKPASDMS